MNILKTYPKKKTVEIESDGKIYVLSLVCAEKLGLKIAEDMEKSALFTLIKESDEYLCQQYLYTQIEQYFKSAKGYADKLIAKGFRRESVKKAIEKGKNLGLINDRYFAERYVERYQNKKGKYLLKKDLKNKGIENEIIEEVLSDIETDRDTLLLLAKKLKKGDTPKDKASLYRKLASRGYSYEDISFVMSRLFD